MNDPFANMSYADQSKAFLTELDGMVEATEEFILDDSAYTPAGTVPNSRERLDMIVHNQEGRLKDLLALEHVRRLYVDVFQPKES